MKFHINKSFLLEDKHYIVFDVILGVIICLIPLFLNFPYRGDLYLTWEGSFRIAHGEIPFKDFGTPFGIGSWIIPSFFLRIFGDEFSSLIYAQVLMNAILIYSFVKILRYLGNSEATIFLSTLVLCLTYIIKNFWPQYSQIAIFYQFLAYALLFSFIFSKGNRYSFVKISLAAFFGILSIFTKQDIGATGYLILSIIVVVDTVYTRNYKALLLYFSISAIVIAINIIPFIKYDFLYWFNYGQSPHESRFHMEDFIRDILVGSESIKFMILLCFGIIMSNLYSWDKIRKNKKSVISFIFTLGILVQVLLIQVTTYIPPTIYWFFYAFGFAYIYNNVFSEKLNMKNIGIGFSITLLVLFWWSAFPWDYIGRVFKTDNKIEERNYVSKYTRNNTTDQKTDIRIINSTIPTLNNIKISLNANQKLEELIDFLSTNSNPSELNVLNMSKLTFLQNELNYKFNKKKMPLWHHHGVCLFERENKQLIKGIQNAEYDVAIIQHNGNNPGLFPEDLHNELNKNSDYILFETIPSLKGLDYVNMYVYLNRNSFSNLD